MASETVDPLEYPLPPTLHMALPPELPVLHGTNAEHKSQDLLYSVRIEHAEYQTNALPVLPLRVWKDEETCWG